MSAITISKVDNMYSGKNDAKPSWWANYLIGLQDRNFTKSALNGVTIDSEYIYQRIIESHPSPTISNNKNLSKGLVFGAIQSGKTLSMFGVASLCIDSGFNIIIFLSGTRIALWNQTYQRLQSQLDITTKLENISREKFRIILPSSSTMSMSTLTEDSSVTISQLYSDQHPNAVKRALKKKRPVIFTVMKHCDHIRKLKEYIRTVLTPDFMNEVGHIKMLIVDDEADDGSVLDRRVENGQLAQYEFLKQLPRAITDIWTDDFSGINTFDQNLTVTYLAYTATPQANILQSEHNPLHPSDFIATIRAPGHLTGRLSDDSAYYEEPSGISNYYIGGDFFYESLTRDEPGSLCITDPRRFLQIENLKELDNNTQTLQYNEALLLAGLRSFLVSAAIRLLIDNKSYFNLGDELFETASECRNKCPSIHTALIHPSAQKADHFRFEKIIRNWFETGQLNLKVTEQIEPTRNIQSIQGVIDDLKNNEDMWSIWVEEFDKTRLSLKYPGLDEFNEIDKSSWEKIKIKLIDEIFPSVKIKIINSDQAADDRPSFDPIHSEGKGFKVPSDLLTIFISGNVMSRGITIEGLTTSIFLRSSSQPLQDTQMQMQRWFGYRGKYIIWCRLFTDITQHNLFKDYHNRDQHLRCRIASEMKNNPKFSIDPIVLSGLVWDSTGKIDNLSKLPLYPGKSPFINLIFPPELGKDPNIDVVEKFFKSNTYQLLKSSTSDFSGKGFITSAPISLMEAADLLDELRFPQHQPDPNSPVYLRWKEWENILKLDKSNGEIIRTPTQNQPFRVGTTDPSRCPYSIAAYFRFWHHCLYNRVPGIFKNDKSNVHWNSIDLEVAELNKPNFYVGIKFGGSHNVNDLRLTQFNKDIQIIKTTSRTLDGDGRIQSTWGSRNLNTGLDTYLGDQLFDYHHTNRTPPELIGAEAGIRAEGEPGLILFYILDLIDSKGQQVNEERLATGVCIPVGGPDTMATMRKK